MHAFSLLRKVFYCSVFLILSCQYSASYAQKNELLGQYYRVIQAYAPALTGANDFMEVSFGSRSQWVGNNPSPSYSFASINTSVFANKSNRYKHNSLRVANLSPYSRRPVKLGLGAYFMNVSSDYVNSNKAMFSFAAHISLTDDMYLALGSSIGIYNQAVDTKNVWVLYPQNDIVYQDFIDSDGTQTTFDTNIGLSLTSSRFYLSYAMMDAISIHLKGYDFDPERRNIIHSSLGGIRLSVSQMWEIIPNYFIRYSEHLPLLFDAGIRAQYSQKVLFGLSFRNDSSFIAIVGLDINEHFDFGYSYELKSSNAILNNLHTHEITIGVKLLNWKKKKSIW